MAKSQNTFIQISKVVSIELSINQHFKEMPKIRFLFDWSRWDIYDIHWSDLSITLAIFNSASHLGFKDLTLRGSIFVVHLVISRSFGGRTGWKEGGIAGHAATAGHDCRDCRCLKSIQWNVIYMFKIFCFKSS